MLCYYYTLIRYEPHTENGSLRQMQCRVRSKSEYGALLATLKIAKAKELKVRKVEVLPEPIPVNRKIRQQRLEERRLYKEQAQSNAVDALINYDPSTAFEG